MAALSSCPKRPSGWRSFYRARNISTSCVSRFCAAEDTEYHAKRCTFMETKWKDEYDDDDRLKARYLAKLSGERLRRFDLPILVSCDFGTVSLSLDGTIKLLVLGSIRKDR